MREQGSFRRPSLQDNAKWGEKKGDPRGNLVGLNSRLARGTALNIVYQQELGHALRAGMDRKSKAGGDV